MVSKLSLFIIINIIVHTFSHQLIINCIDGCKKSYNPNYLCRNFIDDKYNACYDNIMVSFNICSDMCNKYYYSYRECSDYCNNNNLPNNCYSLINR